MSKNRQKIIKKIFKKIGLEKLPSQRYCHYLKICLYPTKISMMAQLKPIIAPGDNAHVFFGKMG